MYRRPKKKSDMVTAVEEKKKEITAEKLPKEWLVSEDPTQLIADFSTRTDATRLARTSQLLYNQTKHAINIRKLAYYVVVEPNVAKVTAMLTLDPTLINVVIEEIIDNSGRKLINNTIFQLAYGAGDDEMCSAIKPFFIKVYDSENAAIEAMERQLTKKFAEDKEADEKQDKETSVHFTGLLKSVIEAITNEEFTLGKDADNKLILSTTTIAAINRFRKEFSESQPKRIEEGMHFRNKTLLETYDAYVQAAAQWDRDYNKCALFEDGVLSFLFLSVPANDAQKFSQGLFYLQDRSEKFIRSLALRFGKNNFYLVNRSRSSELSLEGSCVDIQLGMVRESRGPGGWGLRFQEVCRTKTANLQSLCDLSNDVPTQRLGM